MVTRLTGGNTCLSEVKGRGGSKEGDFEAVEQWVFASFTIGSGSELYSAVCGSIPPLFLLANAA